MITTQAATRTQTAQPFLVLIPVNGAAHSVLLTVDAISLGIGQLSAVRGAVSM
ncbi:MAG: hypothetical protein JO185_19390, partial [Acidobacteriaceae bacterium]|nr:hypothetical protein [Acidobacteriaceae bacterium]